MRRYFISETITAFWKQETEKGPSESKTGTMGWACNVRLMNQGKLEVVKQEMARVNINILGSVS